MIGLSKSGVLDHNDRLENYAKEKASWLKSHPTESEVKMKEFLNNHGIKYEFKKPFLYTPFYGEYVKHYVIADFFIPEANIILDINLISFFKEDKYTDAKYARLRKAKKNITVYHWNNNDFKLYNSMKALVTRINDKIKQNEKKKK